MRFVNNMRVGTKLIVLSATVVVVAFGAVLFSTVSRVNTFSANDARAIAEQTAAFFGTRVKSQVEVAIDEARALASVFEAAEETNGAQMTRQTADAILRHFIESNTQFLDVFVAFEPNAFDNSDARFAGTRGHDSTGRYIPVWSRDADGKGVVEALKDYDVKGAGDYYQVPKERKKESVINPSVRTVNGKDVLMTSLVVPILDANGAFIGVAGIDIDLGFIQDFVKGATVYQGLDGVSRGAVKYLRGDGAGAATVVGLQGLPGRTISRTGEMVAVSLCLSLEREGFTTAWSRSMRTARPVSACRPSGISSSKPSTRTSWRSSGCGRL